MQQQQSNLGSSTDSCESPVSPEQFGMPHHEANPFSSKPSLQWNPRRVLYVVFTCALTGGLAMLIWTKLRLVTGVPRTAYADPNAEAQKTDQTKGEAGQVRERKDARVHVPPTGD
jgi:hypothetical protein